MGGTSRRNRRGEKQRSKNHHIPEGSRVERLRIDLESATVPAQQIRPRHAQALVYIHGACRRQVIPRKAFRSCSASTSGLPTRHQEPCFPLPPFLNPDIRDAEARLAGTCLLKI